LTSLQILPIDHPLLRKKAAPISRFGPSLRRLVEEMFATLHAAEGSGLAAPQIGAAIRLLVAEHDEQPIPLCNPVIVSAEGESFGAEGCLSFPGFIGLHIRRATHIEIQAQDPHGAPVEIVAEGILARILQHEVDHLDGILFLDHLASLADLRKLRPVRPLKDADPPEPTVAVDGVVP